MARKGRLTGRIEGQIGPVVAEVASLGADLNPLEKTHVSWCGSQVLQSGDDLDQASDI